MCPSNFGGGRQGENILFWFRPAIIRELADVLRTVLEWTDAEIIVQLKLLVRVATIVQPNITLHVVLANPDDDRILERPCGKRRFDRFRRSSSLKVKVFEGIGGLRHRVLLSFTL